MANLPTHKSENYNLKWNSYVPNLLEVLALHQHSGSFVDVTLSCEGFFLKAHKVILSACSEFFNELFKIHDVHHPVIILNNVNFNHLKHIIEFMYCGEIKVLDADLPNVLALCQTLQVKGLSSVKVKLNECQTCVIPKKNNRVDGIDNVQNESNEKGAAVQSENIQEGCREIDENDKPPKKRKIVQETMTEPPECPQPTTTDSTQLNQPVKAPEDDPSPPRIYLQAKNIEKLLPAPVPEISEGIAATWHNITENVNVDPVVPIQRSRSPHECDHPYFSTDGPNQKKIKKRQTNKSINVEKVSSQFSKQTKRTTSVYKIDLAKKIPRPPNAFMHFANEWRKKIVNENPGELNKNISIKLGNMWKALPSHTKEYYYETAKKANEEHKRKYPDYYYSPKEARIRKAAKALGKGSPLTSVDAINLVKLVMTEGESEKNKPEQIVIQDETDDENLILDLSEEPAEVPTVIDD